MVVVLQSCEAPLDLHLDSLHQRLAVNTLGPDQQGKNCEDRVHMSMQM